MKCSHVERLMVDYAEGALGVADELCVDIHLVQCLHCREELEGIGEANALILEELTHPAPRNHLRELLEHMAEVQCVGFSPESGPQSASLAGGAVFRFTLAAAFAAAIFVSGAVGWTGEASLYHALPIVEAETGLPVPMAWRSWMERNKAYTDIDALASNPSLFGDGVFR